MQEFISSAAEKLGIDESTASSTTANAMAWLKNNVGGDMFSSIASKIPGADQLAEEGDDREPEDDNGGGGLMASVSSMASGIMGGDDDGGATGSGGILGLLGKSGLSFDKIPQFGTMLMGFIKEKCGSEMLSQIAGKIPILKSFMGNDEE